MTIIHPKVIIIILGIGDGSGFIKLSTSLYIVFLKKNYKINYINLQYCPYFLFLFYIKESINKEY